MRQTRPSTLFSPIFSGKTEKIGPLETYSSCKSDATSQSPAATAPLEGEPLEHAIQFSMTWPPVTGMA